MMMMLGVLVLCCWTRALSLQHPQPTRRDVLWTLPLAVVVPTAADARSSGEMTLKSTAPESDLKGMLGSFEKKLSEDQLAAEQKKIDDAKPLTQKITDSITSAKATPPPPARPKAVAQARVKKQVKRSIGDGL